MKAIIFHEHGGPEVLTYTELPTPDPKTGEALVRLEAAALNHLDLWVRRGWPGIDIEYPHIPGADGAGRIAALGENVNGWTEGERVVINPNIADGTCEFCLAGFENQCRNWKLLGETLPGTYREYITVPALNLRRIPEGFDSQLAAAAALVYMTAWHSLVTRGDLQSSETVLVVGASGGVNTASIQIAKHLGATVYVVGSNADKLALAEKMGADHLIDRSQNENWASSVYQQTNKRGVDVVVDNVGTTFPLSMRAVRKGGRILTVGNTGGAKFEIDNRYIFGKHLSLLGSTMGTPRDFATVMDLVFDGKLQPAVDKTFPLKDARAAHQRLESGEQMGKITLVIP
ncbi:MAG: zinc-binding dehydrogenase [Chloroflexi bacterium]|nr:zinc-binding dehydrogenase [Chloroflexota bacterium]